MVNKAPEITCWALCTPKSEYPYSAETIVLYFASKQHFLDPAANLALSGLDSHFSLNSPGSHFSRQQLLSKKHAQCRQYIIFMPTGNKETGPPTECINTVNGNLQVLLPSLRTALHCSALHVQTALLSLTWNFLGTFLLFLFFFSFLKASALTF